MNKYLLFGIGATAIIGVGGFLFTRGNHPINLPIVKKEIKLGQDVCAEFPQEWVTSVVNKPIVKTKAFSMKGTYKCTYFFDDDNFVALGFDELNFETQKRGQAELGKTITTNEGIPMNHFVALSSNNLIYDIILEITPDLFFSVDRYPEKTISETALIDLAKQVAQRIQNGDNQVVSVPKPAAASNPAATPALGSGVDVVKAFFTAVSEGKIDEPMYKAMRSVQVLKVEESSKADWRETWQQYMVTLNVTMDPASANQPIPFYGFEDGENIRFVNLMKQNDQWQVESVATGP